MKTFVRLLGLGLLLFGQPQLLSAQEPIQGCKDVIHMQDGNRFRGQIQATKGPDTLLFKTSDGIVFDIPKTLISKIIQKCGDGKTVRHTIKQYDFKESGWYHHTRSGLLIGQSYLGYNNQGIQLQHSSGWMFSRLFGLGLGSGIEFFDPSGYDVANYPVFAEIRGYVTAKRISPYFTLGGGWSFVGNGSGGRWNVSDTWKGGWMAQAELGYRIGNHFTVHLGLRFQKKKREWVSWGLDDGFGTDRILHKRLSLGIGLLL